MDGERTARGGWPEAAAALAGAVWFLAAGGWRAVPPWALDAFGEGDRVQHVLGWLFFRRSRWALPLGRIDGLAWPGGTTVGFTDANPLLALPGKLLSPVLPEDFQYVGAWLLACFALQGWAGARLAALATPSAAARFLSGVLFALAPPLLTRTGHDTLCAHFALVVLLAWHLAPPAAAGAASAGTARRRAVAAGTGSALLCAVHPYLALMALALTLALLARYARVDGTLSPRAARRAGGATVLACLGVLALCGYLTSAPSHGGGFGLFSADLLAFVNPFGASWLVPDRPALFTQWEGNAYLGLGGLALAATAAALAVARWRPDRRRVASLTPVVLVAGALAVFALSDVVRAGGREVIGLRAVYRPLAGLAGILRSSGRFVWPLYYLVLGAAVLGVVRLARRPRTAAALLAGALALQLVDLAPRALGSQFSPTRWRLADPAWELARGHYDHLALAPALVVGGGPACRGPWEEGAWGGPAYLAYHLGLTFNSGYLARANHARHEPACRAVEEELARGPLRPRTVYLVHPTRRADVDGRPDAACGTVEGWLACVAATQHDPFRARLRR